MATEEHKHLASIIKKVHESLRIAAKDKGPEAAWLDHLKNTETLKEYAEAMRTLAGIWEENYENLDAAVHSRISWTVDYCLEYFFTQKIYLEKRSKEQRILAGNECAEKDETRSGPELLPQLDKIRMLDVGSCFNPFGNVANFDVTALDLCPADETVLKGDFLKLKVSSEIVGLPKEFGKNEIQELPANYFHCIVFSLLLEYIPSPAQRLLCCQKAYDLLQVEGILIVITPDSQHVGKNAKIMKNWRYTLARMGFSRIRFEKLTHIACMVFRKAVSRKVGDIWAELHHEPYMSSSIDIPQDTNNVH